MTWALAMMNNLSAEHIFALSLPMIVIDGVLGFSIFFIMHATRGVRRTIRWGALAFCVIVISCIQSAWNTLLYEWSGVLTTYYGSAYEAFIRATSVNIYQTGLLVALLAFQQAYLQVRQQQEEVLAAQSRERAAHMASLRLQLNPHFLYNAMNALSGLVGSDSKERAENVIHRLCSYFRLSLSADPARLVTLEEEFEMIEAYLEIERARFPDRLEVIIDLPDTVSGEYVPSMLLQPIVENAVKYAVTPSKYVVTVTISARRDGNMLVLLVSDNGCTPPDAVRKGTGLGLVNVKERLLLEYGGRAEFETRKRDSGFEAEIRIPTEEMGGTMSSAAAA